MKKIITAFLLLVSCNNGVTTEVILSKKYTFGKDPMPTGICRFFYKISEYGDWIEFQDSCYKYNIGDTIKSKK